MGNSLRMAALAIALTACGKLPGIGSTPGRGVDPNSCGGFASAGDAGRKLKLFLNATNELEKATADTLDVVKNSCIAMGNELGMSDADYKGETKDVCAAVYGKIEDGLKLGFKSRAAVTFKVTPPVCKVDAQAQARAAASCEGSAGAEVSAQCRAAASVHASIDVKCTEPSVDVHADAAVVVDKAKAEQTLKALRAGLPKILAVRSRLAPLGDAVKDWVAGATELKSAGQALARQFKDQALCVSGQIAAATSAIGKIEGRVSVSVSVSASATGTIGG